MNFDKENISTLSQVELQNLAQLALVFSLKTSISQALDQNVYSKTIINFLMQVGIIYREENQIQQFYFLTQFFELSSNQKIQLLNLGETYLSSFNEANIDQQILQELTNFYSFTSCTEGFYYNFQSYSCDQCAYSKGQKTCDDQNAISCFDGYFLSEQSYAVTCKQCDSECKTCSQSQKKCTSYFSGFTLTENNKCVKCKKDCETCLSTNLSQCSTCNLGFSLYPSTKTLQCYRCNQNSCYSCKQLNKNICEQCHLSHVLNSNSTCISCSSNCLFCSIISDSSNDTKCHKCSQNYTLKNQKCVKCNDQKCAHCSPFDINFCLTCQDGYYPHQNGKCISCQQGCAKCNQIGICLQTKPTFTIQKNVAVKCLDNCQICQNDDRNKCLKCASGYTLQKQKKICRPCLQHCDQCNSFRCLICSRRTVLKSGSCVPIKRMIRINDEDQTDKKYSDDK